jgi:hypothetical protein
MKYLELFEAKKRVDPLAELIEDIQLVFSYQIDEYPNITIERKTGGIILVTFPKILPDTSSDINDYSTKIIILHTLLENIMTGCQQLSNMRKDLDLSTKLYNNDPNKSVEIKFWISDNVKVFKINAASIVISSVNLFKTLRLDPKLWTFTASTSAYYGSAILNSYINTPRTRANIINGSLFVLKYTGDTITLPELQRISGEMSTLFLEHFIFIDIITHYQRAIVINQDQFYIRFRMVYKDPSIPKTIRVRDLV